MAVMNRQTGKWMQGDLEGKIQAVRQLMSQIKGEVILDREAGIDYLEQINKDDSNLLEMEIMELIDSKVDGLDVHRVQVKSNMEGVREFSVQVVYKGRVVDI